MAADPESVTGSLNSRLLMQGSTRDDVHTSLASAIASPLAENVRAFMNMQFSGPIGQGLGKAGHLVLGTTTGGRGRQATESVAQETGLMAIMFILSLLIELVMLFGIPNKTTLLGAMECSLNYQSSGAAWTGGGTSYTAVTAPTTVAHSGLGVIIAAWTILSGSYLAAIVVHWSSSNVTAVAMAGKGTSMNLLVTTTTYKFSENVDVQTLFSLTTAVVQSLCWVFVATGVGIHQSTGLYMLIGQTFALYLFSNTAQALANLSILPAKPKMEDSEGTDMVSVLSAVAASGMSYFARVVMTLAFFVPFVLVWVAVFSSLVASTESPRAVTAGVVLMFFWQLFDMGVVNMLVMIPKTCKPNEFLHSSMMVVKHVVLVLMTFLILGLFYNDFCLTPAFAMGPA